MFILFDYVSIKALFVSVGRFTLFLSFYGDFRNGCWGNISTKIIGFSGPPERRWTGALRM